ncbi:MAG: hypothetical protein HOV77_05980 [Hamadaea sp.]|uniref:hypothetical protein n=1 Tax=Hamadaea sp. TaxID=2024425 RepID=UPI0017CC9C59|nr:hypothetical protein [Hamadaea sp.]NUT18714.1 hypothetical protein [Hamadaea sp.]
MRMIDKARPALPLRLLLIILLLVGLAYATGRHCAEDHALGVPATTAATVDHLPGLHTDSHHPATPGELLGLCLTMLAGIAGAMVLLTAPARRWAGLGVPRAVRVVRMAADRSPVLAQLGISRT